MKNLHKLYYKDYYKDVDFKVKHENGKDIVKATNLTSNKELLSAKLQPIVKVNVVTDQEKFTLDTLYPGLITGVGISHEAGVEGEFKLGMHFDYTHGMPVIYGSSVKGVLKTNFEDFAEDRFKQFANIIFEGKTPDKEGLKSIYERDVFFDAVVVKPNKAKKILDSDTLCPHGDNPLKNPIPISFLKIASGVTIEFRFKLHDSTIGSQTMTKSDKRNLFKQILTTVGIGAKTNVGYGQLTEKLTSGATEITTKNEVEQPFKKKVVKNS